MTTTLLAVIDEPTKPEDKILSISGRIADPICPLALTLLGLVPRGVDVSLGQTLSDEGMQPMISVSIYATVGVLRSLFTMKELGTIWGDKGNLSLAGAVEAEERALRSRQQVIHGRQKALSQSQRRF